jgi:hypothetical protein
MKEAKHRADANSDECVAMRNDHDAAVLGTSFAELGSGWRVLCLIFWPPKYFLNPISFRIYS